LNNIFKVYFQNKLKRDMRYDKEKVNEIEKNNLPCMLESTNLRDLMQVKVYICWKIYERFN